MIEFLKRLGEDLRRGENLELYVTVVIALVLAVLNVLGIASPDLLASATLATLALLAVGLLVNRRRMEALVQAHGPGNAILFSEEWPDLRPEFERAREIYLVGINLVRTTMNNYVLFEHKLNQGCHLRVLLMDPDGDSMNLVHSRTYAPSTHEEAKASIRGTIRTWMKLLHAVSSPQNLELRVLDYVLPFGLVLVDPGLPSGRIFVETYAYRTPLDDAPKFQLDVVISPNWYLYFCNQFDVLWSQAHPWQETEDSPIQ